MTRNRFARFLLAAILILGAGVAGPLAQDKAGGGASKGTDIAIFAGGCFWCVESDFDHVPGVVKTISGYTGGSIKNPTYERVGSGGTGHIEAVAIHFDPKKVSYMDLVEIFWRSVDPTDKGGQFCDRGETYQTAIFARTPEQKRIAEASKAKIAKSGILKQPIVTPIRDAGPFWPAEDYHQNYYEKNPVRYKFYRYRCGRDARIRDLWGDQAMRGIKKK
jgi:peptide-methionine (S)-S-oxide reductase